MRVGIWVVIGLLSLGPKAHATDGGAFACPSSVPVDGSACDGWGMCEYGGDAHGLCSTFATCTQAKWNVASPAPSCGTSAPDCPASIASVDAGTLCPLADHQSMCIYPEGICSCPLPCANVNATLAWEWVCRSWTEAQPGCPSIRPTLGTSCTQEGQQCMWDGCCWDVPLGPDETCTDGGWTFHSINACSCAGVQACNFAPVTLEAGTPAPDATTNVGAEPEARLEAGCGCGIAKPLSATPLLAVPLLILVRARRVRRRRPTRASSDRAPVRDGS